MICNISKPMFVYRILWPGILSSKEVDLNMWPFDYRVGAGSRIFVVFVVLSLCFFIMFYWYRCFWQTTESDLFLFQYQNELKVLQLMQFLPDNCIQTNIRIRGGNVICWSQNWSLLLIIDYNCYIDSRWKNHRIRERRSLPYIGDVENCTVKHPLTMSTASHEHTTSIVKTTSNTCFDNLPCLFELSSSASPQSTLHELSSHRLFPSGHLGDCVASNIEKIHTQMLLKSFFLWKQNKSKEHYKESKSLQSGSKVTLTFDLVSQDHKCSSCQREQFCVKWSSRRKRIQITSIHTPILSAIAL